jgi:restriction system protein
MNFPTIDDILLPLLKITKDEKNYNTERAIRYIAKIYNLTDEEKEIRYEGGKVLRELVRFCRDSLRESGLIEGFNNNFSITKDGIALLRNKPKNIDREYLESIPKYNSYIKEINDDSKINAQYYKENKIISPKESLESLEKFIANYNYLDNAKTFIKKLKIELSSETSIEDEIAQKYKYINEKLKHDLLVKVKSLTPQKFEELVLEVIFRLVYDNNPNGIKPNDVIRIVGKTGDGGIDGIIIKRDKLKDTTFFIQAKCWKDTIVSRPEIHKFVGALAGQKAKDGIYITTSKFASTVLPYVEDSNYHIILMDGEELIKYMIEYDIGVQEIATYKVKVVDIEFFTPRKR